MSAPRTGADVPVRDAATVVLLRDSPDGLQTWLLTRVRQMVFAAGMSVFPGGRVDADDAELPVTGVDVTAVATQLDCDARVAAGLLVAAVREVFEETGVLLTTPVADLARHREDLEGGRLRFGDLLREHRLSCDGSAVLPWARWVTPQGEPRRYDTRFFLAALPDGVDAADVTSESSEAGWVTLGAAIEQAQSGQRLLMPPTLSTITSLLPYETTEQALQAAAGRTVTAVRPVLEVDPAGGVLVRLPDGTTRPLPRRAG